MLAWIRSKFRRARPLSAALVAAAPVVPAVEDTVLVVGPDEIRSLPEVAQLEAVIEKEVLTGLISIPPMPSGAARMLELVGRPDVDLNELVTAMHWEPSVLVRILAVANTPAFRGRSAVHDDVRGAIIALGLRMVGEIAAGIAARTLFQIESRTEYDVFPELWQAAHKETMIVAFGASSLAQARNMPRPDRVFLRAILAGSARIVALRSVAASMIGGAFDERPSNEAIAAAVDITHRNVAVTAAARGTLPSVVTQSGDKMGAMEHAAVDLVATLVELRRAPGRADAIERAKQHVATLGIQPSWLRVILRDCDDAEHRVAAMMGN
jgi:hypothetical protein